MRRNLKYIPFALTAISAPCQITLAKQVNITNKEEEKPNVVLILADDVCFNDLELYGSKNTSTPNLNKLASEGITFNNCFQQAPMSSPTRHALYTGLYPVRSGAIPNHTMVYDDVKSFVQHFGEVGYRTALYGKEHIAPRSVFSYEYLGDYSKGEMDFSLIEDCIISQSNKPLFLVVASHEAHGPYDCGNPEKWDTKDIVLPPYHVDTPALRLAYRKYLAEVEVLDYQIGKINEIIKKSGKEENTIYIFLSEQGNSFPFAKWTCYSQGLHSGMVIKYPKIINSGTSSDALVEYVDVIPTLLDIAEIKYKSKDFDGKSFAKILNGKQAEHKKYTYGLLSSTGVNSGPQFYGTRSIADKKYRFILNLNSEVEYFNPATSGAIWSQAKESANNGDDFAKSYVSRYTKRPMYELYDTENDPFEMNNLAYDSKYSKVVNKMKSELKKWMKNQGDKGIKTEEYAVQRLQGFAVKKYESRFGSKNKK